MWWAEKQMGTRVRKPEHQALGPTHTLGKFSKEAHSRYWDVTELEAGKQMSPTHYTVDPGTLGEMGSGSLECSQK